MISPNWGFSLVKTETLFLIFITLYLLLYDIGLLAENERMAWVYSNFITPDTEMLAALTNKNFTAKQVELAIDAAKYAEIQGLDDDTVRKLNILRSGLTIPAPNDAAKTAEQSEIGAKLGGMYGKGEYCSLNICRCSKKFKTWLANRKQRHFYHDFLTYLKWMY